MIKNERQYKLTRKQAENFQNSIQNFDSMDLIKSGIDPIIAEAQLRAMRSQLQDLESSLERYERLQSSSNKTLHSENLVALGTRLIEARIARGLTQKDLADRLGMKQQQIQRYEQEDYQSANLQRLSEIAAMLDLSVEIQLALQDQASTSISSSTSSINLPYTVMRKKGWLEEFTTISAKELDKDSALALHYVQSVTQGSSLNALHKQSIRINKKYDDAALLAWKARILHLASKAKPKLDGSAASDSKFIDELVKLSSLDDGPIRAIAALKDVGVTVVVEKHLDKTYLDGAAMLLENKHPVIGMTLRHDRIDNFWFVLLHELGHVVCHRNKGLLHGFFDDEETTLENEIEKEADEFAQNALIPNELWLTAFVKHSNDADHVKRFAERLSISPAIVAGRIRKERNKFNIFNDLVGRNKLRPMLSVGSQVIGGYRAD